MDTAPICKHAKDRWEERTDAHFPLSTAWKQGLRVDAPVDGEEARLHSPEDALIVKSGGVIRTVLKADYRRLDASGYAECDSCGHLADPLDEKCRWCGASASSSDSGGIVIRREGQW